MVRACSHACKFVDGIYEVASTRELINVGMRSVVLCGNCEDVAVDCVALECQRKKIGH